MKTSKYCWSAIYVAVAAIILIVDQITKYAARIWCMQNVRFNSFFSCELVFNRGISWGMLSTDSMPFFWITTSIIMGITVGVFLCAYHRFGTSNDIVAETFIVAGSCANLIDRFLWQGVVDFIKVSWGTLYFPLFNVADIFIVIGVGLLMIRCYRQ